MKRLFKFIIFNMFLLFHISLNGQRIPDSITTEYLHAIASATSDTARIDQLLLYSNNLIKYGSGSAGSFNELILEQSKKSGYKKGIVISLINIAKSEQIKGDFINSFDRLGQALSYCDNDDYELLFLSYAYIAMNHAIQANFKKAATYYYKAAQMAEKSIEPLPETGRIYLNLSMTWDALNNEKMTILYLHKAEQQAIKEGDSICLAHVFNNKGSFFLKSDTLLSLEYYYKCLFISRKFNNKFIEGTSIGNIIHIYILQGEIDQAKMYLAQFNILSKNESIEIYHRLGMAYSYGLYSYLLKDNEKAEKTWRKVINKADSLHAYIYKLKPLIGLSDVYASTRPKFKSQVRQIV